MDTFFAFRINKLTIKRNREFGCAEVKILSFLSVGGEVIPIIDEFFEATDPAEKKKIITDAAKYVLAFKEFLTVDHVKDGHQMYFGTTGYALYTANFIPDSLDWSLVVIDSEDDVRTLGKKVDDLLSTSAFETFATSLVTAAVGAVSPQAAIAIQLTRWLGNNVATAMANKKDSQLGVFYMSFNRPEHYPHGERRENDVPDLSGNCMVDYSLFGTEIGQVTCGI